MWQLVENNDDSMKVVVGAAAEAETCWPSSKIKIRDIQMIIICI